MLAALFASGAKAETIFVDPGEPGEEARDLDFGALEVTVAPLMIVWTDNKTLKYSEAGIHFLLSPGFPGNFTYQGLLLDENLDPISDAVFFGRTPGENDPIPLGLISLQQPTVFRGLLFEPNLLEGEAFDIDWEWDASDRPLVGEGGEPSPEDPVDLTGTVEDADGTGLCALVLASGEFMFSCNPNGPFSLTDLPREGDGTVKRQVYVDGFFPEVDVLQGSMDETVVMTRASSCPDYNSFPDPSENPGSASKRIDISGTVLLQNTQTPVCAIVLANGQFGFTCDGTGNYSGNIPLDNNGQFKLQVYADGFAPMVQKFDEFSPNNDVRMARASECQ